MVIYKLTLGLDKAEYYFQSKESTAAFLKRYFVKEFPTINNPALKFKDFCELYQISTKKLKTED